MQKALITGGQGDLAQAIRLELVTQHYQVHAPSHAELDVTDGESVRASINSLHSLDLLVCNAALTRDQSFAQMSEDAFSTVVDVCLGGAFKSAQAALKLMSKQRSGHIVFIGSFSALHGPAGQGNYAAAKAGMIALMQSLAAEYGSRNVRVNCVLPGFMETRMTAPLTSELREKFRNSHALGRFNTVTEVAKFIAFLDTHMPHTSGQVFSLDSRRHRWT